MGRTWKRFAAYRRFVLADALGIAQWVVIALFAEAAFQREGHDKWLAGPGDRSFQQIDGRTVGQPLAGRHHDPETRLERLGAKLSVGKMPDRRDIVGAPGHG